MASHKIRESRQERRLRMLLHSLVTRNSIWKCHSHDGESKCNCLERFTGLTPEIWDSIIPEDIRQNYSHIRELLPI